MSDNNSRRHPPDATAAPRVTRLLSYQQVAAKRLAPTLTGPVGGRGEADRPILLLAGPPPSGRSTMLKAIQDTYRHTPIAVITDATTPRAEPDAEDESDGETGVADLLSLIVNRLGVHRRHRRYGVHRLDAFTVCFALLHAKALKLPTAFNRKALTRFLRELYFLRFARVHALLEQSATDAASIAWWLILVPRLLQVLVRGIGFPFYWSWKKRLASRITKCATLAPGDLYMRLERLSSWHQADPHSPELETALCEVLLNDLDAFGRHHQRNAVNLVLVDDVEVDEHGHPGQDGARGRLLLRLARAHADYQGKRPWGPLAVIGTCDGPSTGHTTFTEVGDPRPGTDTATPAARLEHELRTFHGDRCSDEDAWVRTWRLPLPNRSDVRILAGPGARFRDSKPVLDAVRLAGQGDIPATRALATAVAGLPRERLAAMGPRPGATALTALLRDARPGTAAPAAGLTALAERSDGTDLGTDHDHIDDYGHYRPPATAQQIRRHVYTAATVAAAALLVAGGVVVVGDMVGTWCDSTGDVYVSGPDGECVGVTDGSYVFDKAYAETSELIRRENERVLADNPDGGYVSIAFLTPLTNFNTSANTDDIQSTLHQLQGAYEAQYQANHETNNKPAFEIRLLLANPGANARQWRPVVADLVALRDSDPENLIGVAGLGSSYITTSELIEELSDHGIPSMASVATADGLLRGKAGAFRVAPDNTAETRAMVSYLHDDPDVKTAMLVKDKNPDDPYTGTLAKAFATYFPGQGRKIVATATYTSNKVGVSENLDSLVRDVCSRKPDVVYFAGRGRGDLPDFIVKLSKRNCPGLPIRIATGDDASHLPDEPSEIPRKPDLVNLLLDNDITVEYSGLVHPWQWEPSSPHKGVSESNRDRFQANVDRFTDGIDIDGGSGYRAHFGDTTRLIDGQAMMAFDAVTVLIEGVRRLDRGHVDSTGLHNALLAVRDCGAVTSTLSGPIELNEDGDTVNKTMVIVRIESPSVPKIVGLAWPEGEATPIREDC